MIVFTVEASNFIVAGKIEGLLKAEKIRYTTKMVTGHANGTKRVYSKRVTPEDVKDTLAYIATHSDDSNVDIGREIGISQAVVQRIRADTHPLCKKVGA